MKRFYLLLFILCFSLAGESQIYTLFYNFEHVNQNLMVNPSNPHNYRYVIGVPGVSRISAHVQNSAFAAGDWFNDNSGDANLKAIVDNLGDKDRLNLYENIDLIYAGFGIKNGYVSFGVQQEATFNSAIPSDLMRFLYYGNQNDDGSISFQNNTFNTEALIQVNYHVGYQHYLLDSTLIAGARFKYISGTAHVHFKEFDASINSDIFEWNVKTDITIESSGYDYIENFSSYNPLDFINGGNPGWGLDLGATYLLPKMKMSASVLNIGSITWNNNISNWQSKGEFSYDGADLDPNDPDIDFDEILDSLESELGFTELSPYSYKSKLPMHILASYEYQVHPKHAFALTYQGSSWNGSLYNNIGVNYIGRWTKRINFILGYSRLAGGLNNIGAGISGALGPVQLYVMSGNVWGALKPSDLSSTTLRVGLNIVFFDRLNNEPKKSESDNQLTE